MPLALINRLRDSWRRSASLRWAQPIGSPLHRLHAWINMILVDHGIFRLVFWNRRRLAPQMWRSAQPNPVQVAQLAREGVKTIVNLRGEAAFGSYPLEKEACARHGITLVNSVAYSRAAPRREHIHALKDVFDRIEYPALLHCKSGADRAGLASVLYLILREGVDVDTARKQLSLKYGHIRQAKTGILDTFFERYLAYNAHTPIAFMDWVDTVYESQALEREFHASWWGNMVVDRLLRRE